MKLFKSITLSILALAFIITININIQTASAKADDGDGCILYAPNVCSEGNWQWAACETPDPEGPCSEYESCEDKKPF